MMLHLLHVRYDNDKSAKKNYFWTINVCIFVLFAVYLILFYSQSFNSRRSLMVDEMKMKPSKINEILHKGHFSFITPFPIQKKAYINWKMRNCYGLKTAFSPRLKLKNCYPGARTQCRNMHIIHKHLIHVPITGSCEYNNGKEWYVFWVINI